MTAAERQRRGPVKLGIALAWGSPEVDKKRAGMLRRYKLSFQQ